MRHQIENQINLIKQTANISDFLIDQIMKHERNEGEKYRLKNNIKFSGVESFMKILKEEDGKIIETKHYHPSIILEKIQDFENIDQSEQNALIKANLFDWGYLSQKELSHVHQHQASNIPHLANKALNGALKEECLQIMNTKQLPENKNFKQDVSDNLCKVAHKATFGMSELPSFKLTGDWIVMKHYNNKNYYLFLALHEEHQKSLKKKIKLCFDQFNELKV
jgi:hypothetical protein